MEHGYLVGLRVIARRTGFRGVEITVADRHGALSSVASIQTTSHTGYRCWGCPFPIHSPPSPQPYPTPRRAMADIPRRIQRRRTKGWRMPVGAIYVGRRYSVIGSGKWSNPFFIGGYFKRGDPVSDYRGPFRILYSQRGIWRPEDIEAALREGYTLIETAEQAVEWYQWYVSTWSAEFIAACK